VGAGGGAIRFQKAPVQAVKHHHNCFHSVIFLLLK
jgi:hypothetical protein